MAATSPSQQQERYSTRDAVSITGLTPRQIQWIDERGILSPEQKFHSRWFTPREIKMLHVYRQLRDRRVGSVQIGKLFKLWRKQPLDPDYCVLTHDRKFRIFSGPSETLDFILLADGPVVAVAICNSPLPKRN